MTICFAAYNISTFRGLAFLVAKSFKIWFYTYNLSLNYVMKLKKARYAKKYVTLQGYMVLFDEKNIFKKCENEVSYTGII